MALPTSGSLRWSQVCAEFGVPVSTRISQMHRGGGIVPNIPANNNIPTSGPINFPDAFYGAANQAPFSISAAPATGTVFAFEPAPISEVVVAGTTVVFNGGTGAGQTVTYTKISGDTIEQFETDSTPRWRATLFRNTSRTAVYRATGRDSGGNVDTTDITVNLQYNTDA